MLLAYVQFLAELYCCLTSSNCYSIAKQVYTSNHSQDNQISSIHSQIGTTKNSLLCSCPLSSPSYALTHPFPLVLRLSQQSFPPLEGRRRKKRDRRTSGVGDEVPATYFTSWLICRSSRWRLSSNCSMGLSSGNS